MNIQRSMALRNLGLSLAVYSALGGLFMVFQPLDLLAGKGFQIHSSAWAILSGLACGGILGLGVFLWQQVAGRLLRTVPPLAILINTLVGMPMAIALVLVSADVLVPGFTLAPEFWRYADFWIPVLAILLAHSLVSAIQLLTDRQRLAAIRGKYMSTKWAQGFFLVLSLKGMTAADSRKDPEAYLRLSATFHGLLEELGMSRLGPLVGNAGHTYTLFIPRIRGRFKQHIPWMLGRILKRLKRMEAGFQTQFGHPPVLHCFLHFGELEYQALPGFPGHIRGAGTDLQFAIAGDRQAQVGVTHLWASDTALQKLVLPPEFQVAGSLKLKEGPCQRLYYLASPLAPRG